MPTASKTRFCVPSNGALAFTVGVGARGHGNWDSPQVPRSHWQNCSLFPTQVCLQYGDGHEPTSPWPRHHASKPLSAHQGFTLQSFSCSQPPVGGVGVGGSVGVGVGVGGFGVGAGGVGGEGALCSWNQAHSRPGCNAWTTSTQPSPWLQPAPKHRPTT